MAHYKWNLWLKGLISAAIGGASGSLGSALAITYQTGGLPTGKAVGIAAAVGAATTVLAYLKQSPMPPEEPETPGA